MKILLDLELGSTIESDILLIDGFTSGFLEFPGVNVASWDPINFATQLGIMLGGKRAIHLEYISGPSIYSISVGSLSQSITLSHGVDGFTIATVTYGKLAPINMAKYVGIYINIVSTTTNTATFAFDFSDGINTSTISVTYPPSVPSVLFIPFTGITGSADMSSINFIDMKITSPDGGLDISINNIEARP